eukprot:9291327-Karenia_brevis.AAC.1
MGLAVIAGLLLRALLIARLRLHPRLMCSSGPCPRALRAICIFVRGNRAGTGSWSNVAVSFTNQKWGRG